MIELTRRRPCTVLTVVFAVVALLPAFCRQTLAAQQTSGDTTHSRFEPGLLATCCRPTEELWERYRNTRPEARPPELAFLGAHGFSGALRAVVKDTVMWARLWSGMHHGIFQARARGETQVPYEPPLPYVDFAREMLILVGTGERPSTGYSVQIDSVRLGRSSDGPGELRVYLTEWRPGRMCAVGWTVTSPMALARLRRLDRMDIAVRFVERTRYMSCQWPRR